MARWPDGGRKTEEGGRQGQGGKGEKRASFFISFRGHADKGHCGGSHCGGLTYARVYAHAGLSVLSLWDTFERVRADTYRCVPNQLLSAPHRPSHRPRIGADPWLTCRIFRRVNPRYFPSNELLYETYGIYIPKYYCVYVPIDCRRF